MSERRDFLHNKINLHRRALDRAVRDLAALDRLPDEDPFVNGDVIEFKKTFDTQPERSYTYVAVRVKGLWWTSGRFIHGFDWEKLIEFMTTGGTTKKIWKLRRDERIL
jgi:hypothetical protein